MPLVDQPFADTFTFARGGPGAYRDATGASQTALTDTPRFDHDEAGTPLGLLVEGRPARWRPDRLRTRAGDWTAGGGTVLHEYQPPDGPVKRRAWYSPGNPQDVADACLGIRAHHREIAYVPVMLKNLDGFVRWRSRDWALGALLLAEPDVVLAASGDLIILEG